MDEGIEYTAEDAHHPEFPPSSFPMKGICPAFTSGEAGPAAEKGQQLHQVFEKRLNGENVIDFDLPEFDLAGVEWAVDLVKMETDATKDILTETRVSYGDHYFGTADVINGNKLFDLKTGEERADYLQMCAYALALMESEGFDMEEVECHILYSKYRKHQVFTVRHAEANHMIDELLVRSGAPNPQRVPCEYCAWCKHSYTCDALLSLALKVSGEMIPEELQLSGEVNEEEAKKISRLIPLAKAVTGWSREVMNRTKDFDEIPDYKWREQNGARFVPDSAEVYHTLDLAVMGDTLERFLECCSLSVSKLEQVFGKAIVELLPIDRKPNIRKLVQDKTND